MGLFLVGGAASGDIVLNVDFSHLQGRIGNPDGADDGDRIQDLSGNNHHGFWGGGGSANDTPIIATPTGTGLNSSATDGHVILRDSLSVSESWFTGTTPTPYFTLDAGTSYTFEAVLNWQGNVNTLDGIMGQTGATEWWIRENGGQLEYVFDDGPDRVQRLGSIDISGLISNSDWHHLAIVLDRNANEIRSYIDGAVVDTFSTGVAALDGIGSGTGDIRLGAYNTTASARFDGLQDQFRISNTALTPAEFLGAVPEPSALALIVLGSAMLMFRRRF